MKKITILDTSVGSENIGDQIIVDSVNKELKSIFPDKTMFLRVPTHEKISDFSHGLMAVSRFSFVAGTNLLTSNYRLRNGNQWNIGFKDAMKFSNLILMGVGWNSYQSRPGFLSRIVYTKSLSKNYMHSVRDSYTKKKLEAIGIKNVYNTGCPTMWSLTEKHCKDIPQAKAKDVICTLTDYAVDHEKDYEMLEILKNNYRNVYFWIQGARDLEYLKSFSASVTDSLKVINPDLQEFDALLDSSEDLDYVGTRLHAGIRAMQKKRRSIIIGVDNRAIEIRNDFNINVLERKDIVNLGDYINTDLITDVKLDRGAIDTWKNQFKE